jgi:hypothetical protein
MGTNLRTGSGRGLPRKQKGSPTLIFRLPPETLRKIVERARYESLTVSDWLRRAVKYELGKKPLA